MRLQSRISLKHSGIALFFFFLSNPSTIHSTILTVRPPAPPRSGIKASRLPALLRSNSALIYGLTLGAQSRDSIYSGIGILIDSKRAAAPSRWERRCCICYLLFILIRICNRVSPFFVLRPPEKRFIIIRLLHYHIRAASPGSLQSSRGHADIYTHTQMQTGRGYRKSDGG